jgi:hypothetical protein
LGFEEARLEINDVFAELVVLSYQGLDLVLEGLDVLDFFLEFTNISLFALAEGAL